MKKLIFIFLIIFIFVACSGNPNSKTTSTTYRFMTSFSEGLAAFSLYGKNLRGGGYIDKTGKVIIKPIYYFVTDFSEGFACVKKDDKWFYIDKTGKKVINKDFEEAHSFCEGLALVKKDGKYGYINKNGDFAFEKKDYYKYPFSNDLALVKIDDKYGYINKSGKIAIEPKFKYADRFSEDYAVICETFIHKKINGYEYTEPDDCSFINKQGEIVFSGFNKARIFSEGLAAVFIRNEGWGFIDKTGKVVIKPQKYYAYDFSEGLAAFEVAEKRNDGKYYRESGYIDKEGKVVFSGPNIDKEGKVVFSGPNYELLLGSPFREGLACLSISGKKGFVDKAGKLIFYTHSTLVPYFSEGLAPDSAIIDGKCRDVFVDRTGKIVIDKPIYAD